MKITVKMYLFLNDLYIGAEFCAIIYHNHVLECLRNVNMNKHIKDYFNLINPTGTPNALYAFRITYLIIFIIIFLDNSVQKLNTILSNP